MVFNTDPHLHLSLTRPAPTGHAFDILGHFYPFSIVFLVQFPRLGSLMLPKINKNLATYVGWQYIYFWVCKSRFHNQDLPPCSVSFFARFLPMDTISREQCIPLSDYHSWPVRIKATTTTTTSLSSTTTTTTKAKNFIIIGINSKPDYIIIRINSKPDYHWDQQQHRQSPREKRRVIRQQQEQQQTLQSLNSNKNNSRCYNPCWTYNT